MGVSSARRGSVEHPGGIEAHMTGHTAQIAIVGCGHAARRHAGNITNHPRATLAACFDTQREASETFAREFNTRSYADLDQVLDARIDGVVICTPPSTHVAVAEAALSRGLRVLCEKPLAPTTAECERLIDARGLACAFKFRHLTGSGRIRDAIAQGELGRIIAVRGSALSDTDMSGRWFSDPSLSGGGVLLDNGVHLIDLCHYLLGPTQSVLATTPPGARGLAVEESASIRMQMMSGTVVDIFVSWEAPAPMPPLVEIWGTKGFARLGYDFEILDQARRVAQQGTANGHCVWRAVIDNFVAFLHGDEAPMARAEDGFAAVAVAEAAYMSAVTQISESPSPTPVTVR